MPVRGWDADSYHRISGPMVDMARRVLDRLPLRGDETVLDVGCGTGRVTQLLCERLPRGRVIAVDASTAMAARARDTLSDRAHVLCADILELELTRPVDAIFSTATFHWIRDHDRLFGHLHELLVPGGRLVAQCGGAGNIAHVLAAADRAAASGEYADALAGFERPTFMAGASETQDRLRQAGFDDVRTWLEPNPVVPDDPLAYLGTVTCGPHLERLPEPARPGFVARVASELPDPVTIDYVRLNIDARRPW